MIKHLLILILTILAVAPASAVGQDITKNSLVSEGKKRTYYLIVPASVKPEAPAPLVILLHGSGNIGSSQAERWKDLANKEGFIAVAPDSVDPAYWSTPADGPVLLRDLVDELKAKYPINPRRVYLFGHSGGAAFGLLMALYESEYFAGVAIHAGALNSQGMDLIKIAKRKTPIHMQVGTQDPMFPLSVVRSTRNALQKAEFPVELKEIPNHDHNYYGKARDINQTAWSFLKLQELAGPPVYEAHNFKKGSNDSKRSATVIKHYNQGVELLSKGDTAGAIAAFTKVIEIDPKDAEAHNNRGVAYSTQKNLEEALRDFNRSIELKPSDSTYANRAGVHFAMKQIDLAIADLSEALKLKPTAEIYTDRGLGYAQSGKVDLAIADYAQAIQLNPKFARSYLLRGLLLLQTGQLEAAAQKDFDTGFALEPALHAEFDDIIKQIRTSRGLK